MSLLMGNTKKERKIRNKRKRRNEGRENNKGKDGREDTVWGGEINYEFGINIYTVLYINKKINIKDLLHGTGNYIIYTYIHTYIYIYIL